MNDTTEKIPLITSQGDRVIVTVGTEQLLNVSKSQARSIVRGMNNLVGAIAAPASGALEVYYAELIRRVRVSFAGEPELAQEYVQNTGRAPDESGFITGAIVKLITGDRFLADDARAVAPGLLQLGTPLDSASWTTVAVASIASVSYDAE